MGLLALALAFILLLLRLDTPQAHDLSQLAGHGAACSWHSRCQNFSQLVGRASGLGLVVFAGSCDRCGSAAEGVLADFIAAVRPTSSAGDSALGDFVTSSDCSEVLVNGSWASLWLVVTRCDSL